MANFNYAHFISNCLFTHIYIYEDKPQKTQYDNSSTTTILTELHYTI